MVKSSDWISLHLAYSLVFGRNAEPRLKMLLEKRFVATYGGVASRKEYSSLQSALLGGIALHAVEYLRVDDRASSVFSVECRHRSIFPRIARWIIRIKQEVDNPAQFFYTRWRSLTKEIKRGAQL